MVEESFGLRLRFKGGDADNNELDAYDGSVSLHGFAQALQIATHAYVNGTITNVATSLKGAQVFMRPARQGSFITDFTTVIRHKRKGVTLNAPTFYDFIGYAFNQAVGKPQQADTTFVKSLSGPKDVFFDELAEQMEGSLQRAHRVITEKGVRTVSVERPRGGNVAIFDQETSLWVNTRDPGEETETFVGNVTRYNTVSPNGRAYIDEFERILPFSRTGDFPPGRKTILSWSIRQSDLENKEKVSFQARRVESASGVVKRLLISDCERIVKD